MWKCRLRFIFNFFVLVFIFPSCFWSSFNFSSCDRNQPSVSVLWSLVIKGKLSVQNLRRGKGKLPKKKRKIKA